MLAKPPVGATGVQDEQAAPLASGTPSRARVGYSMARGLSRTPSVPNVADSALRTPLIQKCSLFRNPEGDHPLEQMVVFFEEEGLQITTSGLLGKGGFGKVFAAHSNGGDSYALKVSSKRMTEGDWRRLREEVSLMNHFSRHPNIVRFIAAGRDSERAYVLMERCANRSLHDIIAFRGLDLPEILWIGWALVNTVAFIHARGCMHRDLKPQNLLFDFEGTLKITDFGLSSRITGLQPRKTVAGTAMYMAPEMAEEVYRRMTKRDEDPALQYGKEVDTWSIGVVLYVLMTRMNPYTYAMERRGIAGLDKEHKTLALFNAVADAAWEWPVNFVGDGELRELVEHILHRNPARRANISDVLVSPVWNRRPISCPLTLLHKLNLLERSASASAHRERRSLSRVAERAPPTGARRTVDEYFADCFQRLESTEQRTRTLLTVEYQDAVSTLMAMSHLCRAELRARQEIKESFAAQTEKLRSQFLTRRLRRSSASVLPERPPPSMGAAATSDLVGIAARRAQMYTPLRQSSVILVDGDDRPATSDAAGTLVRASPDRYAVMYPGRDTATRWSLRPVVSLPREISDQIERQFRCLNRHIMTKLTAMPHGYNGFDCNVCDGDIVKISADQPAYRCYRCDYDICMRCAYEGKFKDVNFVCVTCAKKFTSNVKLQAHSLQCRGPSVSPSPQRASRMNTMLWEETSRPSLLEVQLPDSRPSRGSRVSGRSSMGRSSVGERISLGGSSVEAPENLGDLVLRHTEAVFPALESIGNMAKKRPRGHSRSPSVESMVSLELPPEVRLSKFPREAIMLQPRAAAAAAHPTHPEEGAATSVDTEKANASGEVIGIAARRQAAREASAQPTVITIRAELAAKPSMPTKQSSVPRSASAVRRRFSTECARSPPTLQPVPAVALAQPTVTVTSLPHTVPPPSAGPAPVSGVVTTQRRSCSLTGGPPLPRTGAGMPHNAPRPLAMGVQPSPIGMATISLGAPRTAPKPFGSAYLALPRDEGNRQQFVGDFLSGGWVRFYAFTNEDTVVMYYSVQAGRYGAMFPTEAGVGTAVIDIHSKLVLYVPSMNNESTDRSYPHPHVQTFYEEETRIMGLHEAQRSIPTVLNGIMAFVAETARLRAEGLTPAAMHASYVNQRNLSSVPKDTKFVYIRKVFPDPSGTFTLFRLSNLRSQVVCNAMVDIRWQSDRRHNVGQKYYVHADGTAEPFVVDHTGILSQVEAVLSNSFRR